MIEVIALAVRFWVGMGQLMGLVLIFSRLFLILSHCLLGSSQLQAPSTYYPNSHLLWWTCVSGRTPYSSFSCGCLTFSDCGEGSLEICTMMCRITERHFWLKYSCLSQPFRYDFFASSGRQKVLEGSPHPTSSVLLLASHCISQWLA